MAEIILEPTAQSKVIPLSLRLNDTDTSLVSQLVTNRQFNTADTDAWFSFTLEGLAATTGTFDLTLINLQDKSVFNHTDKMFNTNPFYYKLDSGTDELTNEIRHAGKWVGQLVVTLPNGDSATRKFIFAIEGHVLDGAVVQTVLLEDYNALISDIESAKDELTQYNIDYSTLISTVESQEAARVQAELTREQTFNALVDSEIIAQNVATELQNVEATYAPRLLSAEQQLAEAVPYGNLEIKSVNWYVRASGEFTSARAEEILNRLVLDGFNSVTIIPMWYMQTYTSNEIVSTDVKTPPDSDIVSVIQNAHSKGLSVVLKPHVEVNDGTPRSNIAPTDTSAWFVSYNSYIVRMAQIAQANNVEYFVVGTELQSVSSSVYKSNWETVISNTRSAFTGVITYAAIWGSESASCSFWELVDYIGINMWSQRTNKDPYTLQDIYDSFYKNYVGATDMYSLKYLSNTYAKPVLLTEIGCISYSGALARPAVYEGVSDPIDNQVPADFAEAMYTVLSQNVDWIKGFCWWDIHNSASDLFSFEGKPAEIILKKWNTKDYREIEPLHNLSKTHGFDIFTEENHNSNGNPHTQYLLKSPAYRINQITSSADLNKYSLVMQIRLTNIYSAQDVLFDVFGTTSGNYPVEYGSVYFRVYQYAAMGIEPYIDLIVDGNSTLKAANFVAVITKNDSLETVVKLYYKATLTNEYIAYHVKSDVVSPVGHQYITYYDRQTYSATLPSGTQKTPTYPDKQFNSIKIGSGNYDVLNSNTHNSTGDPHTQYAKVSSRASIQQATALGYYGKFASITFHSQYSGSVSLFSVTGYAHPTSPQKGLLWVRCYQNGVMGSVPTTEMKLFNARGLKPSDFIAVIKQNDGTATVIEIYVSLRVIYDTLFMNMIHSEKGNITLHNNQALVTSLPSGTQILATYDDVALTSANGTNYKLVVDNAGLLSTVVLS